MDGSRDTATPDCGRGDGFGASATCTCGFGFSMTLSGVLTGSTALTFSLTEWSSTFTGICFSPRRSTIGAGVFVSPLDEVLDGDVFEVEVFDVDEFDAELFDELEAVSVSEVVLMF